MFTTALQFVIPRVRENSRSRDLEAHHVVDIFGRLSVAGIKLCYISHTALRVRTNISQTLPRGCLDA